MIRTHELENRIVAALTTLRENYPQWDRHMFVFPTSLMTPPQTPLASGITVVALDPVMMLLREKAQQNCNF